MNGMVLEETEGVEDPPRLMPTTGDPRVAKVTATEKAWPAPRFTTEEPRVLRGETWEAEKK